MTQQPDAAGEAPEPTARLYDRRTLLQLSQSEHVHVPEGMASFDEWYGPWRPYTPRPHPPMMGGRRDDGGGSGAGTFFSRRDAPRDGRGGRRALLDGAKGASASAAAAPGPRARAAGKGRSEKEADDGRSWRRVDDAAPRAASGMPAWMADDSAASRPVGGVETIEAFKAQMREMERRERGESPVAAAPPREEAARSDEPEAETETSSRFARFFDTKSDNKAASNAPSSQNVGGLDLFGMFQTMQKRETPSSSAAESPAAHTAPSTPTAPRAAPSAPAVRPAAPPPVRAPPPSVPSEAPVDGLPKPSAADMASMQMLMAKLMGRPAAPPESRGPAPPSAPPEAPPGLSPRPPVPPMGLYPRPMPRPAPHGAPMSQMDFLQSLLRTSAPGTPGAAGAPPPPPGLYPAQPPSWPQGAPHAAMPLPPGIPMPMGAPPGLGGDAHGANAGWRPPP
ncbi:hypothetical protein MCAP1_003516 [Malassezia caprae]|uniref:Uncharacterized protein n=1 Tax=Malassezia caprae TaxID=1381934 RepID=A0AAF0E942_9BASI|nr:hypothetical protein MCAP1_003516 [Malassezia caprae]